MAVTFRPKTETDATPDWPALGAETVRLLSEYVRLDTTNPPGNEVAATDWIARVLAAEGIPYKLYASDPTRPNLVATLHGDGSAGGPLVLLNHTDVVPVEIDHWTMPPFGGLVKDGYVWGRGAMDMKGMGVLELMTLIIHHRLQLPLRRDLTFIAAADEEAGGAFGIDFLDAAHPELLDCAFVINEGGTGAAEVFGVRRPVFHVCVSEKGPLWLRLVITGTPGHGSVPHGDSAIDRLLRAVARVTSWKREPLLTPEVGTYFDRLYAAGILPSPPTPKLLAALAEDHPRIESLLTNSIAVTSLRSGVRPNVIPAQAEATLDVRLLAGTNPERFIDELRATMADPMVRIERIFMSSTPASPTDTPLFSAIERAVEACVPGALVVPSVATGFTDSRVFRRRGIPAYGFIPLLVEPEDGGRSHGNDERVSVDGLGLGLRILHATVRGVCG